MLLWRLTGTQNIFFHEGEAWMKHSSAIRAGLQWNLPIEQFVTLSHKLFSLIGTGGRVFWDSYMSRFTADAIGIALLGFDFEALDKPNGSFVQHYQEVVRDLSDPLYVSFPILGRYLPRTRLLSRLMDLRNCFQAILDLKRQRRGSDFTSYMLDRPGMSDTELLDNMVAVFMAGHGTTAGALSSIVYYLAKHPYFQDRARTEVLSVLHAKGHPTIADIDRMPFVYACIKESMRLNGPSININPRISATPLSVGPYTIPPNTPIVLNLYAVLHDEQAWPDAERFNPDRFMFGQLDDLAGWLPFGTGPRRCPASNFALYEQRTLVALLLREYEWSLPADSIHADRPVNAFSSFALNMPKDMYIDFKKNELADKKDHVL
ncbi:hypothetical protein EWM64_g3619 [Hericium alpestre]|uniref:Cytochrome P450 n=1 Tax=Hericium alpestre TaxID=135208 RepID=A0A4Y9ZZY6_9AGAM|nr:hypothetical protein EWM64_g3619 [Hericium alpestre]